MSETNESTLLDSKGNPIEFNNPQLQVPEADRRGVALKILQHYTHDEPNEQFIAGLIHFAQKCTNNNIQISAEDPNVQSFCIGFGAENIINTALDENLPKAYALVIKFMTSPEYQENKDESFGITDEDIVKISEHFINAPEIQLSLGVCGVQAEIDSLLDGTSGKKITTYQANRIQEKFDDIADYLNAEQRAAGYYNISIIHRALLMEKDNYDPSENNAEKECLKKVLEYSSDYKKISYCVNRLGDDNSNLSAVKAAYRRSLAITEVPNDLYKIHNSLAQCYLQDYKPVIGYVTPDSPHKKQNEKLKKAEFHYKQAFKYAQKPEQLGILKNIAKLQLKQNRIDDWTKTETKLAMEFLRGEDRINALLEVAGRNKEFQPAYLEKALSETVKSRKINHDKKKILLSKINHFLRPLYTTQANKEGLKKLDEIMQKYASKQQGCPLDLYQRNKKHRN